jgi:hypothetical protein
MMSSVHKLYGRHHQLVGQITHHQLVGQIT